MKIHKNFIGGNIKVIRQDAENVYLENELRDTQEEWFYWAFCVEGAVGKTVVFHLQSTRLGYWGPAVSHDLKEWKWLDSCEGNTFTYTFREGEDKVYFAHSLLYHPDRFSLFSAKSGLKIEEFCKSGKGRSIPCVKWGKGKRNVILTARHHACESTGNYVLEGVLEDLIKDPIDATVLCVPFVDFDGVIDGDQGKNRFPHDHNRDYEVGKPSIYSSTATLREYAENHGCQYAFDFHSPWHCGNVNDVEFIVQNSLEKLNKLCAFGEILERECTSDSFQYYHKNDYPFGVGWNQKSANFGSYMTDRRENELAFSLETPYFGTKENKVSQENLVALGRCFARALRRYIQTEEEK